MRRLAFAAAIVALTASAAGATAPTQPRVEMTCREWSNLVGRTYQRIVAFDAAVKNLGPLQPLPAFYQNYRQQVWELNFLADQTYKRYCA